MGARLNDEWVNELSKETIFIGQASAFFVLLN